MKEKILLIAAAASGIMAVLSCSREIDFDACGRIDATQVTVSAESNGKILDLELEEGDRLSAGQVVGCIDTMQISLQIKELKQRIEGSGSRLVDIRTQKEPDVSQLASLENDLARYSKLLAGNAATQKQVDDLKDKIAVLKAKISAQDQSWSRNNSTVQSDIRMYEIQLAQKEDLLSKCHISAPVSGTVLAKYAETGENVTSGKPLFKIADMDRTYVRAYFTTVQLSGLKLGDTVTVIPDDGSQSPKKYEGRISWISDQAEFTPKNIQTRDERADMVYAVKVMVPNDGSLRLGMFAYIKK